MEKEMWLTRNCDGYYEIWFKKPRYDDVSGWWFHKSQEFISILERKEEKKWLNLDKHLPKGEKGICKIKLKVECEILK